MGAWSGRGGPARRAGGSALALAFLLAVTAALAASGNAAEPPAAERVVITSDRLLADMQGREAEFVGNVRAVQGDTTISAERLKVFYARQEDAPAAAPAEGAGPEGAQIERIEAHGRVVIHFGERVAEGEHAVYTAADRVLVITGDGARITSGPNTVTGGRIVMDRDDDRLTVEKETGGRVEAVFFTEGGGLR